MTKVLNVFFPRAFIVTTGKYKNFYFEKVGYYIPGMFLIKFYIFGRHFEWRLY